MKIAVAITWIPFWLYWLAAATGAKQSTVRRRRLPVTGLSIVAVVVLVRVFRGGSLAVHDPVLGAIGVAVFAAGLALAIWSRVHLGRNWGMPMTERIEPELVTSGPYRLVRNPIYTGLLLGVLGTALVTNLFGLIVVALLAGCFYWSATTEERNLARAFPDSYPAYQARTKMFLPFIL
ncbi:MAG: methyltransferase family protein [Acidimicrobiales bacterium]